jgi:hypothetical protein
MEASNGTENGAEQALINDEDDKGGYKLRFCTVCASNQNRYVSSQDFS